MPSIIMEVVMGGTGSGAYRSTNVANVEDVLALDVRVLRRLGALVIGECVITNLSWSRRGLSALEARLRADMRSLSGVIALRGSSISQHVDVDTRAAGFGGRRYYFVCPITSNRCEVLYLVDGQFASRQGHRLSYAVQNITDLSRARRKAEKIRQRLAGDGLPQARGRKRFELITRLHDTEGVIRNLYREGLRRRVGTLREPSS